MGQGFTNENFGIKLGTENLIKERNSNMERNGRKNSEELRKNLRAIDRKSYPAYKSLAGGYDFGTYQLWIDHVQGDPFASPSNVHIEISQKVAGFPEEYYKAGPARRALSDFLIRQFARQVETYNFKAKGSGKSGLITITRCGQEVLERSACEMDEKWIQMRFFVGFPAFGRTIQAGELEKILFEFLPACVEKSLIYRRMDQRQVQQAVHLAEDQAALRQILKEEKLAAFVANGSILPRKSGVSDLPMKDNVPFVSPASMERTFVLPHRGEIKGMAVPEGITLIVGGGYHGKSTLLDALQMGVYDHIAGDGREFVLTENSAVKLRAEDGRSVKNVDISLFINNLPNGKDTHQFSTPDASGSTSQAAAVMEGLEAGTRLFLIDEDTSATNFMVRDDLMQHVIQTEQEPITPFLERARDLYEQSGVSTILVAGSSGAFFYIADQVIQMDRYRPVDITAKVKEICGQYQPPRIRAPHYQVLEFDRKLSVRESGKQENGFRDRRARGRKNGDGEPGQEAAGREERMKIRVSGRDGFSLDHETVEMRFVEQLADGEQSAALAQFLRYALTKELKERSCSVTQLADRLELLLNQKGWSAFTSPFIPCGLARPRRQEIFAAINRYRG